MARRRQALSTECPAPAPAPAPAAGGIAAVIAYSSDSDTEEEKEEVEKDLEPPPPLLRRLPLQPTMSTISSTRTWTGAVTQFMPPALMARRKAQGNTTSSRAKRPSSGGGGECSGGGRSTAVPSGFFDAEPAATVSVAVPASMTHQDQFGGDSEDPLALFIRNVNQI
jgi:hypothetical protein